MATAVRSKSRTPKGKRIEVPVGFHDSAIIMLIAEIYGTLPKVIGEIVQNSLDANASKALIVLDMERAKLNSWDDGEGTTQQELRDRLGAIGKGFKRGKGKVGEKNLGNLAGIGAGSEYTLTSRPRIEDPQAGFFTLFLNRKYVRDNADVSFVIEERPAQFKFGKDLQWATTAVSIKKIERSMLQSLARSKSPIEAICDLIEERFRNEIRKSGIQIKVCVINPDGSRQERLVKPPEYPGSHQPIEIQTSCGPVLFDMFLTRTKQPKPSILVSHQTRISFPLKGMEGVWSSVSEVFGSGYFQGTIVEHFCEITGDKDDLIFNDQREVFIQALLKFVQEYGLPWLGRLAEERGFEEFEGVAQRVLSSVERVLEEHGDLDILGEIFGGAVSKGHVDSEGGSPAGKATTRRIRKRKKPSEVPVLDPAKAEQPPRKPRERKMFHKATSSDSGTSRRSVPGQKGLVLHAGEGTGYRAKVGTEGDEKGKLVINIAHPDYGRWQRKGKSALDTYVRTLVQGILAMALMPEGRAEVFWEEYQETWLSLIGMIVPQISGK